MATGRPGVFWCLRIYGPATVREIAALAGQESGRVRATLVRLEDAGLARADPAGRYDVTEAGRRKLEAKHGPLIRRVVSRWRTGGDACDAT
jgi:DNA-binding MarR family transcriptional regulator